MQLTRHASAADFLRDAAPELEQNEAANSLLLGVALSLVTGDSGADAPPYLATVRDSEGLALAALMTPPYPLALGGDRVPDDVALRALIADLLTIQTFPTAVVAETRTAERFTTLWADAAGQPSRIGMRQRIHELAEVQPVPVPPGRMRPAHGETDAEQVGRWLAAFEAETAVGVTSGDVDAAARRRVAAGEFAFWDDGEPRAMAAQTRPTRHTISINAVYTPPEWRGRGYASALVATLSQKLLDEGFARCVLFTDLTNPTSNRIYARVGYRPVADFALHRFGGPR